jgi:hypothetical protein
MKKLTAIFAALAVAVALPQSTVPPISTPPPAGFTPGRTVYVNALGQWASVAGAVTNCVVVSGASIPCLPLAPTLAPGMVVFVNSNGQFDGVIGSSTDCVHADGSTGACGTSGSSGGNARYEADFASVQQILIPAATHGLGTGAINFTCYVATGGGAYAWALPSGFLVDASNNVTINWSTATTGRCVLQ